MSMDESTVMKLDAINLAEQKPQRTGSSSALKTLQQKLRKFFDEADGHGSLIRKPPPAMMTPQYFKMVRTIACTPIKQLDWITLVNTVKYKRKFIIAGEAIRSQRSSKSSDEENSNRSDNRNDNDNNNHNNNNNNNNSNNAATVAAPKQRCNSPDGK